MKYINQCINKNSDTSVIHTIDNMISKKLEKQNRYVINVTIVYIPGNHYFNKIPLYLELPLEV